MLYNHVTYPLSDNDLKMVLSIPEGGNWAHIPLHIPSKRLEQIRKSGGRTTLYGRLSWSKPSYTITTYFNRPGNGAYIHPKDDRVISAREAARLQSFPDDYVFHGSKTSFCKQIGNAVPPLMAYFIAKQIKSKTNTKNVLDLFCGSGGLSKGFEWAGYNIVAANDNFHHACETYKSNHKKTVFIEGDIADENIKNQLYKSIKGKKIDIIIGGPPCQGFSYAGKRLIDDPRNFLFREFVEVVKKIKPKVILVENVEGILTSNGGKTFSSIKDSFSELGYKIHGKKMHAVKFGVPQKRKRVVMIGVLSGKPEDCYPEDLIIKENKYTSVKDAIGNLPTIKVNGGKNVSTIDVQPKSLYQEFISGKMSIVDYEKKLIKSL